ncbi:cadherin-like domain-containing protein [Bdellovibrio bacteriovorus]|uniref:cadherin-like domain-containing protein n=1 Tax=Bdellovibrio bacteriovorus TaxID=959 RepID=UPI0021CFCAFE|nr:cadherin-like domain-containing protein [Bdellovibrio bacteriovorus]UXR66028.1 cadherin-like domain-containing protein [Bdellovibrio bacteriovorus]
MIKGRIFIHIIMATFLAGCMNADLTVLSSNLQSTLALRPAYKSTSTMNIRWSTNGGSVQPNYFKLEYSADAGSTWSVAEAHITSAGSYDWPLATLAPGNYKARLTAVINESEETIMLGDFLIDDQPPVAGIPQTVSVTEDTPANFVLSTPTENDQYEVVIVTSPGKGTLSGCGVGASLNCTYAPQLNNEADDSFSYKVVDRAGNESSAVTVTLDVLPVNDLPVIGTLSCPLTIGENYNYSCTISATDVDLPSPLTLSYSLDAATTCGGWLGINVTTGEVSGTPAAAQVGTTCHVAVYAEDDQLGQSTRFTWDISITNSAPIVVVTGGPYAISEDAPFAVVIPAANVSSIEEGTSTYSLVTPTVAGDRCEDYAMAPVSSNYSIDATTGAFSFRPAADYDGVCQIRIALTDAYPSTGYADVAITVSNVQDVPVVSASLAPCSASATEDVSYSCTVMVVDPDPENLTITRDVSDTCSWLNITPSADGRSIAVSGTPDDTQVGTCRLALKATDPLAASDMEFQDITVANAAPALTLGTPTVLTEDDPAFASLVQVLSDAQVSSLDEGFGTYSLVYTGLSGTACNDISVVATPVSDVVIDVSTGAVSIKPRADYFGTCYAKVQFDDGNGAGNSIAQQEISIIVNPVNDAPAITVIPADHEILLNPTGSTPSSFALTVDIGPANENSQQVQMICTNSNPSRLMVDCSQTRVGDGTLTVLLSATAGLDTSAVVTVKLKDDAGGTDESTVATVNVSITDAVVLAAIATDTTNYNIYSQAVSQYNGTVASSNRTFVVTVNGGVKVSSADPSLPAMRTGSLSTGARVRLINNGWIVGAAGAGGFAPAGTAGAQRMGQHGGTAFKIDDIHAQISILNNGMIYGGGGGGGRGGTDNSDAGAGGAGGMGEGPSSAAVAGTVGASAGGAGGTFATSLSAGTTPAGDYSPSNGIAPTQGSAGQGGSSCLIGSGLGNNPGEAYFGRGGFGAGFGGGAGACSTKFGGGGGGGHFGGGGGSGGLADLNDGGNVNTDTNGYNGGNGGAAIEVPAAVSVPADIAIEIIPGGSSQIAGCVWNDISGVYLSNVASDTDVNNRVLSYSSTVSQSVNSPSSLKIWSNGRGKAYR